MQSFMSGSGHLFAARSLSITTQYIFKLPP
jgi:hypothetical protein